MFVWTESTWMECGVSRSDGVLAALSGGADSVALLLGLCTLRAEGKIARLYAAHLHHGIRAEEADADEVFSKALCASLGVPFVSERIDVLALAASQGISVELAARNARYAFLERVRTEQDLQVIALGHHRDDQAETLLLHLLRGSGTDGLAAMRIRTGNLIRPLLRTGKDEILAFLSERGQSYRTDSTNLIPDATRNRIRLMVLPTMEEINPAAKRMLAETAARVGEDAAYLGSLADRALMECGTDRAKLLALDRPIRLRVLKRLLPYDDFTRSDLLRLDELLHGQTGDVATLKNGVIAWLDASSLRFDGERFEPYCVPLCGPGTVKLPNGTLLAEYVESAAFPCGANEAFVDADRLTGTLTARSPQKGDRFTPLGMKGTRLLSDCYTDRKVGRFFRNGPVVCDEEGIVFVSGLTIDERLRVTAQTKRIYHFVFEEE